MESDIPMLKSVTQLDYGRRDVFDSKRKYIFVRQVNLATVIRLGFNLIARKLTKMIGFAYIFMIHVANNQTLSFHISDHFYKFFGN